MKTYSALRLFNLLNENSSMLLIWLWASDLQKSYPSNLWLTLKLLFKYFDKRTKLTIVVSYSVLKMIAFQFFLFCYTLDI